MSKNYSKTAYTAFKIIFDHASYDSHLKSVENNRKYFQKSEYFLLKNTLAKKNYEGYFPVRYLTLEITKDLEIPDISTNGTKNNFQTVLEKYVLQNNFLEISCRYNFKGFKFHENEKNKLVKKLHYRKTSDGLYMKDKEIYSESLIQAVKSVKFKNYLFSKGELNEDLINKMNNL